MKYTQEQLKQMALDFLYYYNSGDPRSDHMIHLIHVITDIHQFNILSEIQKLAEYTGENNE